MGLSDHGDFMIVFPLTLTCFLCNFSFIFICLFNMNSYTKYTIKLKNLYCIIFILLCYGEVKFYISFLITNCHQMRALTDLCRLSHFSCQ